MSKEALFRKIFPYDPSFSGMYSRYAGYSLITLQKDSPGVLTDMDIELPVLESPIFCSELKRSIETALLISSRVHIEFCSSPLLNEILFDLTLLTSENEFVTYGSNLVRQRFIKSFVNDELQEKRQSIKNRIESLIKIISELKDGNYFFISHSFFLKILQIYLSEQYLFQKPELLFSLFDLLRKTFDFGHGFNHKFDK